MYIGAPCDILGSWNSEIIGLRFDINETTSFDQAASSNAASSSPTATQDLTITIFDHSPPKRNTLMDRNWTFTGAKGPHGKGGPFYISASQKKEQVLATFTGT